MDRRQLPTSDEQLRRARQRESVTELALAAAMATDPEELSATVARSVRSALQVDVVRVVELAGAAPGDGTSHANGAAAPSPPAAPSYPRSMAECAVRSGHPVVTHDLASEPRFADPVLHHLGVVSGAAVALRAAGRCFGVIGAFQRRPRTFLVDELRYLRTVADVLAAVLARRDAESALVARERQLRSDVADRLASVGALAAGVAHELNNPLSYVRANLTWMAGELARRGPEPSEGARADLLQALSDALDGTVRMSDFVRHLRTFSRADDGRSGPVDIAPVLASCLGIAAREIGARAQLVRELAPVPLVDANEARLGQVFLDLLVNATHALPKGRADRNRIRVATGERDGLVVVEVQDTGSGPNPEHPTHDLDRLPGTTPGGSAPGLEACHELVQSMGGEIEVESELGKGSTFRVLLRKWLGADARAP